MRCVCISALSMVLALHFRIPAAAGEVAVRIGPEQAVIENPFLSIEMSTASKKLRTLSIANRITGAVTGFEGDGFVLVFASGRTLKESNFSLERAGEEPAEGGGKRLAFDLASGDIAGGDLRLRLRIEMRPEEWWAARWIEIQGGQGRLEKVSLSEWRALGTYGPPGPGKTIAGLGAPQGIGQAAYVDDLFFAIEHPGAENFGRGKRIACRIAASDELGAGKTVVTRRFVVGAGEAGGALQAFLRFIGERRASPARMVFLAGGEEALRDAARPAWIAPSFQIAPEAGRVCLGDTGKAKSLIDSVPQEIGIVEIDGFRPDCAAEGHGHPAGPAAAAAQMDALIEVLAAWRKSRPGILIGWTGGSNPSPFWLEHLDFLGPGGADGEPAGEGDPLDRHATTIDGRLQVHRPTDLPISALAVADLAAPPVLAGASDAAFERNAWWLAARTALAHLWSAPAKDLPPDRWKVLDQAARWAKAHERLFRLSRMVGGDPRQGVIYGFSAFESGAGVLALRNPAARPAVQDLALSRLLVLPRAAVKKSYRLAGVFGATKALEGVRPGDSKLKVELPPLAVAIFEVKEE